MGLASNKDSTSTPPGCGRCSCARRRDPQAVGDAWFSLEGVSGFDNLQAAIGQLVPFEDRFGDFAVRAYNQRLEPGDPIDPAFWDVDPTFPDERPVDPRAENGVDLPPDGKLERSTSMPPLWSHSTDLITVGVPTVTFDFGSLSGTPTSAQTSSCGRRRTAGSAGRATAARCATRSRSS